MAKQNMVDLELHSILFIFFCNNLPLKMKFCNCNAKRFVILEIKLVLPLFITFFFQLKTIKFILLYYQNIIYNMSENSQRKVNKDF